MNLIQTLSFESEKFQLFKKIEKLITSLSVIIFLNVYRKKVFEINLKLVAVNIVINFQGKVQFEDDGKK